MKVSLVQLDSRDDKDLNFKKAMKFAKQCLPTDVICFSERFLYWGNEKLKESENLDSKYIKSFQDFAKDNNVNIIFGSVALKKDSKVTNTSIVINRNGEIIHKYDKIYMFNVNKEDIVVKESESTIPGSKLGFFELEGVKIGLGICYDLRYPEYFQSLALKGAEIIFLPANFRKRTGELAWDHLTKARAIENQVYFCACGQTGESGVKERCGKTRILSYDGKIINEIEVKEGIIFADLDLNSLRKFRKDFPVLKQIKR
jgi:predicted amidohydrolase